MPVCSGVSLCLLHPFIQTKERERTGDEEEEEEAEGLFPHKKKKKKQKAGEKNTNEEKRILLKNGYFSPLWGSQRRVYISKLIENDE